MLDSSSRSESSPVAGLTRLEAACNGLFMHRPAWVLFAFTWLIACYVGPALGQTESLQLPDHPRHDQPVKPPSAAPRTPVHKAGHTTEHKTPVVEPHRDVHAHKVETKAAESAGTHAAKSHTSGTHTNGTRANGTHASGTRGAPAGHAAASPTAAPVAPPAAPAAAPAATKPAAVAAPAVKPPEAPADAENAEAKKLPRFVSLRSDDVNMRAGPGTRYRIEWVYKRRDLPVEIERVFEVWRWVRDPDGIEGWVHQATLMGRRSFIVQHADATLRSEPSDTGTAVAVLKVGVIGRIRSCRATSAWCNVQAGSYRGYLRRDQFWGVLPGEAVTP